MVYGCGNKCVKYLVFFFNFLVFVVGAAILGVSLAVRFSNDAQKYFEKLLSQVKDVDISSMYIPLYVLMAIGALLLLTGFLGCCGAFAENTCLLSLFFAIILILFIAELGCGIAILVNKTSFENKINDGITKQMNKFYTLSKDERDAIDTMQKDLKCCGCINQTDYTAKGLTPPDSCNVPTSTPSPSPLPSPPKLYPEGCCSKVWREAEGQLAIVGGVAIGILVIELLAMIFSCILCQAFRRHDYQYA